MDKGCVPSPYPGVYGMAFPESYRISPISLMPWPETGIPGNPLCLGPGACTLNLANVEWTWEEQINFIEMLFSKAYRIVAVA